MIKKTFIIFIISILTTSVFAQYGTMTITSNSNQKFWLFIDDVLQNEYSTHSIKIMGMQFMYYKVRVEMDNAANNCVGQTIMISKLPNQNNFVVNKERGNNFSFNQSNQMPNPFFAQNIILPNYNYYSAFQQYLFPGFNPNVSYGQGNQYRGNTYKGYQHNYQSGGYGSGGNQGYGNQGQGMGNPGYGNPPGYGTPPPGHGTPPPGHGVPPPVTCMPAGDFNRAYSVIQGESFENTKLNTAKQVTSVNYLCVSQIIQICKLFSFEQTKLDYAKFAYPYCVDQNNYYLLNEVFTYAASKDELRKFIGGK
jgi:hypothetical protein